GDVAFAGVNDVFLFFAFLILDGERRAVRSDQIDFYFAKFAVAIAVGGAIGEAVLVAQECSNFLENPWNFPGESREPGIAASFLRKRLHLILVLQEVDFASMVAAHLLRKHDYLTH